MCIGVKHINAGQLCRHSTGPLVPKGPGISARRRNRVQQPGDCRDTAAKCPSNPGADQALDLESMERSSTSIVRDPHCPRHCGGYSQWTVCVESTDLPRPPEVRISPSGRVIADQRHQYGNSCAAILRIGVRCARFIQQLDRPADGRCDAGYII